MDDSWTRSSFWRALTRTFALGRIAGFEIRIHWSVFVYFLFALHLASDGPGTSDMRTALVAGIGVFQLFAIVLIHELGHGFAARHRGLQCETIQLSPLGGLASVGGFRNPSDELYVTFWGPAVHPVLIALAGVPYMLVERGSLELGFYAETAIYQFMWINIGLLAFNLIPAFPLDGGRILRAVLARRSDASRATFIAATVGKVASVLFVIVGVIAFSQAFLILMLIGVRNFFACERARQEAKYDGPYEQPGWMYGVAYEPKFEGLLADSEDDEKRPGFIRRFLESRAERRRAREALDEAEVKRRVDAILERVSQVGLHGLSDEERGFLQQASNLYRRSVSPDQT